MIVTWSGRSSMRPSLIRKSVNLAFRDLWLSIDEIFPQLYLFGYRVL